jgi:hypothetical protein
MYEGNSAAACCIGPCLPRLAGRNTARLSWPRLRLASVESTWAPRDLPVLDATVRLMETNPFPSVRDIAATAGMDIETTGRAVEQSPSDRLPSVAQGSAFWAKTAKAAKQQPAEAVACRVARPADRTPCERPH